jgi:protein-L-isoaspartate(D-aspartate) O-methyltransferase
MDETTFLKVERSRMVSEQLVERGIHDKRVLEAMGRVPRELFVLPEYSHLAYTDGPLPISERQTISQPYIVALMSELLELKGDENVLEVGTGSGYQTAILACLARQVHSIELFQSLAEDALKRLNELGLDNLSVHVGDGSLGWPEAAPYHGILVTAAAPEAPQPLLDQLAEGGCLVIPVGGAGNQVLETWKRHGDSFSSEAILPVAFVPLRGKHGWKRETFY